MVTLFIISLISAFAFFLWKDIKKTTSFRQRDQAKKLFTLLFIGFLSFLVIFDPKIRNRIQQLKQHNRGYN